MLSLEPVKCWNLTPRTVNDWSKITDVFKLLKGTCKSLHIFICLIPFITKLFNLSVKKRNLCDFPFSYKFLHMVMHLPVNWKQEICVSSRGFSYMEKAFVHLEWVPTENLVYLGEKYLKISLQNNTFMELSESIYLCTEYIWCWSGQPMYQIGILSCLDFAWTVYKIHFYCPICQKFCNIKFNMFTICSKLWYFYFLLFYSPFQKEWSRTKNPGHNSNFKAL